MKQSGTSDSEGNVVSRLARVGSMMMMMMMVVVMLHHSYSQSHSFFAQQHNSRNNVFVGEQLYLSDAS